MWQSQSAASARGQPFFACEMLRHHASCGRCHRGAPAGTSAMRRAVDGAAPPLFLQVPGPRGAEEVARAHATATQTPCTPGYVETGRRWCPSRWSRRLVAVPDSSCLQRSSPGRCWSRRRSSLVRVVSTWRRLDLRLGRRDADGGRTRNCWVHLALRLGLLPQFRCRRWSCRSDGAYVITRLLLTQDRRAYSSKMPSRHFNKWAIEQGPKARPSKPR